MRARSLWLFLDADRAATGVKLHHAVTSWVGYVVREDGGSFATLSGTLQEWSQTTAVKNVVAENQGTRLAADEGPADEKGLGEAVRAWLLGVVEIHADPVSVAQQGAEPRQVLRRRNDEHVADSGQHERGERIIDHRLIVDRHQLLAGGGGQRIESGSCPTGENDSSSHHGRGCSI